MPKALALLVLTGLLAACSSPAAPAAVSTVLPTTVPAATQVALAPWQTMKLVDARNGNSFTLADFRGKTVYVEPMATWCTNCRAQFGNVKAAREKLGADSNVVFIGISVETDLKQADLASYVTSTGFDWSFAVATPDLLSELVKTFGRSILNPPSTPHFVIYPDGSHSDLSAGIIHSTDEVIRLVTAGKPG